MRSLIALLCVDHLIGQCFKKAVTVVVEYSQAAPPCAAQGLNSSCAVTLFGSDTPVWRARQRVVQVFVVQLDPEAWVESAPDHALAMHLQDRRRCARPKTRSVGRTDRVGPHKWLGRTSEK